MSLDEERTKNTIGRSRLRWVGLALLAAIVVCALLNVFGQRPVSSSADSPDASLSVTAPDRLRGDLIFEGRFVVHAHRRIARPVLELGGGWIDSVTMNSINPTPQSEHSRGGALRLVYSPLPAGRSLVVTSQWQVNPTNVGSGSQDVVLYDAHRRLAAVDRDLTVFP